MDGDRDWDDLGSVTSSCAQPDLWEAGGGIATQHIIPAHSLNLDIRSEQHRLPEGSVSDSYSWNPDPPKNLNPDPSCFLTLPGI